MAQGIQLVVCRACDVSTEVEHVTPSHLPPPCPKCGGNQIFSAAVNATADVALGRRLTAREPGRKKPTVEMRADHTISKRTSEPVFHERTIDRRQDRYSERVTLKKTGEVIHSCDEPLSSHKGHGSARRRRRGK